MHYITQTKYERMHTDYKGIYQDYQENSPELKGRRTIMLPNNGGLAIEGVSFEIVNNYERDLTLVDNQIAKYQGLDDWHRPIYTIAHNGKEVDVCLVDNKMYSYTNYGEPDCPLKSEYQLQII